LAPTSTTAISTLSLHDALPICCNHSRAGGEGSMCWPPAAARATLDLRALPDRCGRMARDMSREVVAVKLSLKFCLAAAVVLVLRSEEHTSELQSRFDLVCRLLL